VFTARGEATSSVVAGLLVFSMLADVFPDLRASSPAFDPFEVAVVLGLPLVTHLLSNSRHHPRIKISLPTDDACIRYALATDRDTTLAWY
jgi:hypothetical protein